MELSVQTFLDEVQDEKKRADSLYLLKLIQDAIDYPPRMWGKSIIGFGSYHYIYQSGREGDAPLVGFSPRKNAISIYLGCDLSTHKPLLKELGNHKTGKGCLYIKSMDEINQSILIKIIQNAVKELQEMYPA